MKDSKANGTVSSMTREDAVKILAQIAGLRESVDALEKRAYEVLKKPDLEVIRGGKTDKEAG